RTLAQALDANLHLGSKSARRQADHAFLGVAEERDAEPLQDEYLTGQLDDVASGHRVDVAYDLVNGNFPAEVRLVARDAHHAVLGRLQSERDAADELALRAREL